MESENFRIIKCTPIRNHRDQYFEKNFRKSIKFYKKIEKQLQKLKTKFYNFVRKILKLLTNCENVET